MDKISVLMSVYNEKESYLRLAIESILNQTYSNIEFIIVNDDPDNNAICTILAEYAEKDSRIILITNERNIGLDRSLNHGLSYVSGDYIARMDSNDFSYPDRLEKEFCFLKDNDYDFVACFHNTIDKDGQIVTHAKPLKYTDRLLHDTLFYSNFIAHPAWLVKRNVFSELNGYRHIFGAEDYDFILRAIEKGFKIGIIDETLIDCRTLNNSLSGAYKLEQTLTTMFFYKHMGHISQVSESDIAEFVGARVNDKVRRRFEKARLEFYIAAKSNFLARPVHIIKGLFSSKYSLFLLKRIILGRKYKRLTNKLRKNSERL